MPGEDPSLREFAGARRWLTIYEQRQALLNFNHSSPVHAELDAVSAGIAYWRRRVAELSGLELDSDRRVLQVDNDTEVTLTPRELQLLEFLLQHPERFFPDHVLAVRAWGERLSGDQVRIYVRRLRGKLEGTGWELTSRRGQGYALVRHASYYRRPRVNGERPSAALIAEVVGRSRVLLAEQQEQLRMAVTMAERLRESLGLDSSSL